MNNKWVSNREAHTHTHAALVNARPWASYKKGSCKSGEKKKNVYQQHAYAWLRPLKDGLIKWVSG